VPARAHLAPRATDQGRFFYSKAKDCARCLLKGDCLSKGRVNKAVIISDDYPALLGARRRRETWSAEDRRLYQRHRWRSEDFHGEAKTWHGLARAVRCGLANMKIQAYLTAAAINLKQLAAALLALLLRWIVRWSPFAAPHNCTGALSLTVAVMGLIAA
jgi:Transposase DDE domain